MENGKENMGAADKLALSKELIERLPKYSRVLGEYFYSSPGISKISSGHLAKRMNVTPSQVRNDLGHFTVSGQQGYGYNVKELYMSISEVLGFNNVKNCVLIGAGNIGKALIGNKMFNRQGFQLLGVFDIKNVGASISGIEIRHIDGLNDFAKEEKIDIAIFALPSGEAQKMAERVYALGIKGILNFCYTDILLPDDAVIENIHLIDSLIRLSAKLSTVRPK